MRYFLILLLFTSCSSLKHKSISLVSAGSMTEVKTTIDKDGNASPCVFMGSKASIVTSNAPVPNGKHSPSSFNLARSYSILDYFFGNKMGNVSISYTCDGEISEEKLEKLIDLLNKDSPK